MNKMHVYWILSNYCLQIAVNMEENEVIFSNVTSIMYTTVGRDRY